MELHFSQPSSREYVLGLAHSKGRHNVARIGGLHKGMGIIKAGKKMMHILEDHCMNVYEISNGCQTISPIGRKTKA